VCEFESRLAHPLKQEKLNMQMKRWESPRREGRNDKGKKSSARQRQIKKATKALLRKIKGMEGKEHCSFPFLRLWVRD
jgi:hypothetical protein